MVSHAKYNRLNYRNTNLKESKHFSIYPLRKCKPCFLHVLSRESHVSVRNTHVHDMYSHENTWRIMLYTGVAELSAHVYGGNHTK